MIKFMLGMVAGSWFMLGVMLLSSCSRPEPIVVDIDRPGATWIQEPCTPRPYCGTERSCECSINRECVTGPEACVRLKETK